ncbi:MAG: hydroxyacid dehydrogenase [Firmicutes bacterium]|jgi:D-3-phosphoglycerate dehydrogenase|nr:hydroxyacid dehydrogenase [Bacillota bacterium]
MKPKVLLTEPVLEDGLEILEEVADVHVLGSTNVSDVKDAIIDADALIVKFARITREIITCGRRLRVIGKHGIGVDTIDLDAACERGIMVLNVPAASHNTVAEHTIALVFALLRHIPGAHVALSSGDCNREEFLGWDVTGKTLGLIGAGRIGMLVAQKAMALGMVTVAFDPYVDISKDDHRSMLTFVSFDELIGVSDIVSIHVPLNENTRRMIGERELLRMKSGSFLINTSRADIIDEHALFAALKIGKLAGAALDVFQKSSDDQIACKQLMNAGNVIFTPHIAAFTHEAQKRVVTTICQDVANVLMGKQPTNPVHPSRVHTVN